MKQERERIVCTQVWGLCMFGSGAWEAKAKGSEFDGSLGCIIPSQPGLHETLSQNNNSICNIGGFLPAKLICDLSILVVSRVMAHTYNPSTWEAKVTSQASLSSIVRHCHGVIFVVVVSFCMKQGLTM